jgi:hypothetical protein
MKTNLFLEPKCAKIITGDFSAQPTESWYQSYVETGLGYNIYDAYRTIHQASPRMKTTLIFI